MTTKILIRKFQNPPRKNSPSTTGTCQKSWLLLVFFYSAVSSTTKSLMVKPMCEQPGTEDPPKRVAITPKAIKQQELENFVTKGAMAFFNKRNFTTGYIRKSSEFCSSRDDFQREFTKGIKVTNIKAERSVALIK